MTKIINQENKKVTFLVEKSLMQAFKIICIKQDKRQQEIITSLIKDFVEKNKE